jgi:hypothetical protein
MFSEALGSAWVEPLGEAVVECVVECVGDVARLPPRDVALLRACFWVMAQRGPRVSSSACVRLVDAGYRMMCDGNGPCAGLGVRVWLP